MSAEEIPPGPPLSPTKNEIMAARLATIVANSDDAIVSKTLEGFITSWNAGAERIFGYSVDEMVGQHITRIIPPELHEEEARIISKLKAGERIEHFETVRVAKDGRRIHLSISVSPMRDSHGRIIGASKVARDITERKRAEEMQRLLLDELNHRIKNTLATVQAIATQTLRRAASPTDFVESFNGRIKAMARAHALLAGGSFQGAEITDLVREQLLLSGEPDPRIAWAGPSITLEAQPALHLALVLHELGTNARKHGALSTPNGRVTVNWQVRVGDARSLQLNWCEAGGPPVTAPTTQGFGSILIEQSLRAHGGEVSVTYAVSGLTCQIDLPLSDHAQPLSASAREADKANALSRRQNLKGKRILVVRRRAADRHGADGLSRRGRLCRRRTRAEPG